MNGRKSNFWTAVVLGLLVPGVLINCGGAVIRLPPEAETLPPATIQPETVPEMVPLPVDVRRGQTVTREEMDEYLVGVVLAEMPASFEGEALKAQAVAARTYARKVWQTGGKHGDGSVCTDPACCQAWIDPETYLASGGTREGLEKVSAAVAQTSGWVLTYGGSLIEATYFSSAGSSTESALAVWGTDYPYLQAVDSPEEGAGETVTFTPAEFQQAWGRPWRGTPPPGFGRCATPRAAEWRP